jgi:hypothetical protein
MCLGDVGFKIADATSCRLHIRAAKYAEWIPPASKEMYFQIVRVSTTNATSLTGLLWLGHDFRRGIGRLMSPSPPEVHPAH